MIKNSVRLSVVLFIFLLKIPFTHSAEPIIFSTAPTHSSDKTEKMYRPLLEYISKEIGREIVFRPSVNFTDYNNKIQSNEYDFLFDGPHFVNWRMLKFNHEPLVRLPGEIRIVVVAKNRHGIQSNEDLVGKRVCTFPSPNLLTMIFLDNFRNPMRQPILVPARGFKGLESCIKEEQNISAVLRDKMWDKMKDKQGLEIIHKPVKSYPERTFSISKRIDRVTRQKIRNALLSDNGKKASKEILKVFKRKEFVEAREEEYSGMAELLNPVWGYELR